MVPVRIRSQIIWIDGLAGLVVGLAMFCASPWLVALYEISWECILLLASANCGYGIYSTLLACRKERPLILIRFLAIANWFWAGVCLALTASWFDQVSVLALLHLGFEGFFVAALAMLEWRWQQDLVLRHPLSLSN